MKKTTEKYSDQNELSYNLPLFNFVVAFQ